MFSVFVHLMSQKKKIIIVWTNKDILSLSLLKYCPKYLILCSTEKKERKVIQV